MTRYSDIISRVQESVRKAGKRSYIFLLGKPNVPKLANFPEIDVFVMIACPMNSVVNSKDFMQPVVTPFELDLAFNANREWNGDFEPDFQQILPQGRCHKDFKAKNDMEEADVSLVTGKVRGLDIQLDSGQGNEVSAQERGISVLHENGGGQYLAQRAWTGLEQKLGETKVEKASQGQRGIAFGYEGEGKS